MKPSDYQFDLWRIFIGEFPLTIYFEIVLRTALMYIFAVVAMRLLSKRGSSQLTFIDVVLIIALGSAVGDPMFYADIPVLFGFVILAIIIIVQRLIVTLSQKIKPIDDFFETQPVIVVQNGQLKTKAIQQASMTEQDILMQLRLNNIEYLEEVRIAYLEPSGKISVFKKKRFTKKKSTLPKPKETKQAS